MCHLTLVTIYVLITCPLGFWIMRSPNLKPNSLSNIRLITFLSVGKGYLHVKFEIELDMGFRGPKGGPKV